MPYVLRAVVLALSFVLRVHADAGRRLHAEPTKTSDAGGEERLARRDRVRAAAIRRCDGSCWRASFTDGVSIYAFYAMQPYLLQLYGDPQAYGIAGLAAAIVGGAQIGGGLLVPYLARVFRRRTSVLLAAMLLSTVILALIGLMPRFWIAIVAPGAVGARCSPPSRRCVRRIVNGLIPSEAARDGAVVRLAHGLERRRRHSADPRQGGRRLGLSALVRVQRGDPGAGHSVRVAGPARAGANRTHSVFRFAGMKYSRSVTVLPDLLRIA